MLRNQRIDIQVFRGICVLAVILFHTNFTFFEYGYLGVDVFFVISGFVITPILVSPLFNSLKDLKHFYLRRFFRLVPGLSSSLLIMTPLIFLLDPIYNHQLFSKMGISSLVSSANLAAYKLTGDYFSQNPNPLIHLWSLSTEAQIYLLFPVLLILLKSKFSVLGLYCGLTILSSIVFLFPNTLKFIFKYASVSNLELLSYYLPTHRIWQFTLGGLVYLCSNDVLKKKKLQKILTLLFVMISFVLIFVSPNINKSLSIYVTVIFSFLILIQKQIKLTTTMKLFTWLGDRSYSIYLFHLPILYLASYSPIFANIRSNYSLIFTLMAILCSFFLGHCNYKFVENKYRIEKSSARSNNITIIQILRFVLIPILILNLMLQGSKLNYFGLNHDAKSFPIYPGKLDSECYSRPKFAPCLYNNPSSEGKKLMLIGNSFAGHYAETIKILSRELGYDAIIWSDLNCNIDLPGPNNTHDDFCVRQNQILQKYITNRNPDVIVLSEFIKNKIDLERLKKVSLTLVSPGRKIILIENNPIFPDSSVFMRYRPILSQIIWQEHKMDFEKKFPVDQMELSFKLLSDQLVTWGSKNGITVVRIWDSFCNEQECTRYNDGVWLYSDYNHLSLDGANKLLPLLSQSIK